VGVSIATDGSYIYVNTLLGLSKIGTGHPSSGTVTGKSSGLLTGAPFAPEEPMDNFLVCVRCDDNSPKQSLLYRTASTPESLYHIDTETLQVTG